MIVVNFMCPLGTVLLSCLIKYQVDVAVKVVFKNVINIETVGFD